MEAFSTSQDDMLYPVYMIEQTSSKYGACINHSLHKAIIRQTSSCLIQLTYSSSSSQLIEPA